MTHERYNKQQSPTQISGGTPYLKTGYSYTAKRIQELHIASRETALKTDQRAATLTNFLETFLPTLAEFAPYLGAKELLSHLDMSK